MSRLKKTLRELIEVEVRALACPPQRLTEGGSPPGGGAGRPPVLLTPKVDHYLRDELKKFLRGELVHRVNDRMDEEGHGLLSGEEVEAARWVARGLVGRVDQLFDSSPQQLTDEADPAQRALKAKEDSLKQQRVELQKQKQVQSIKRANQRLSDLNRQK